MISRCTRSSIPTTDVGDTLPEGRLKRNLAESGPDLLVAEIAANETFVYSDQSLSQAIVKMNKGKSSSFSSSNAKAVTSFREC